MTASALKGCVSLSQEENSYSQNTVLEWDRRRVMQSAKYQVLSHIERQRMPIVYSIKKHK